MFKINKNQTVKMQPEGPRVKDIQCNSRVTFCCQTKQWDAQCDTTMQSNICIEKAKTHPNTHPKPEPPPKKKKTGAGGVHVWCILSPLRMYWLVSLRVFFIGLGARGGFGAGFLAFLPCHALPCVASKNAMRRPLGMALQNSSGPIWVCEIFPGGSLQASAKRGNNPENHPEPMRRWCHLFPPGWFHRKATFSLIRTVVSPLLHGSS